MKKYIFLLNIFIVCYIFIPDNVLSRDDDLYPEHFKEWKIENGNTDPFNDDIVTNVIKYSNQTFNNRSDQILPQAKLVISINHSKKDIKVYISYYNDQDDKSEIKLLYRLDKNRPVTRNFAIENIIFDKLYVHGFAIHIDDPLLFIDALKDAENLAIRFEKPHSNTAYIKDATITFNIGGLADILQRLNLN